MRRRELLLMPAAAFASPSLKLKIAKVEVFPAPYGVSAYFKFLPKPQRPSVFVKVTADDGSAGWGQSVPIPTWSYETPESVLSTIREYLGPALIGSEAADIPGAHARMNKTIAGSFSTGMPIAKAGIDLALHDLVSRASKKTLAELWGKKPVERIELSWTVNVRTLAEAEALVEDGRRLGYKHFNMKVAPDANFDVELCRRVRKLAPDAFLWIDANGGYDPETALSVAPKFADIGVNVFEQPVAPARLTAFRELKKQKALPILMDEAIVSSVELAEFIKLGLLDGVAMKPARTAGLWDARRQIELLQQHDLLFLGSGLTDPDVSLAASLVLYGSYALHYPAALNGLQFLKGSYLKKPFALENGGLAVPKGLGLGVEVDERRIEAL